MDDTEQLRPLERVAAGDPAAVREVIERYGDLVWSLARRFTGSDADAEEAVQEIFVHLWRKAGQYDPSMGNETTFVSVLTRRLLIDRWRRSARAPRPRELDDGTTPDGRAAADGSPGELSELARRARREFDQLTDDVKLPLRLSIEFGYPHTAISRITGVPLGTIKTRIRSGLTQIRDALRARDAAEGGR